MQENDVPQDNIQTYQGMRKLLYAVDKQGHYTGVNSQGWEVEALVNGMAVEELNALANAALQRYRAGQSSPLEYYMYHYRLDLPQLAQATGLFRWRIRRHMQVKVWQRLSDKVLQRYAEVFDLDVATLKSAIL